MVLMVLMVLVLVLVLLLVLVLVLLVLGSASHGKGFTQQLVRKHADNSDNTDLSRRLRRFVVTAADINLTSLSGVWNSYGGRECGRVRHCRS